MTFLYPLDRPPLSSVGQTLTVVANQWRVTMNDCISGQLAYLLWLCFLQCDWETLEQIATATGCESDYCTVEKNYWSEFCSWKESLSQLMACGTFGISGSTFFVWPLLCVCRRKSKVDHLLIEHEGTSLCTGRWLASHTVSSNRWRRIIRKFSPEFLQN